MKHPVPKDARKVVAAALRAGCTLDDSGRHSKLRSPDGRRMVIMSKHITDPNAARNIKTDIERMARECGFSL